LPNKLGIVVTTINAPSPRILDWLKLANSTLIVVGDTSTPHDQWLEFCDAYGANRILYFDCDAQEKAFPQLSKALGWRTYARKNIGYLFAKRLGFTDILETDDDTFPRSLLTTTPLHTLWATLDLSMGKDETFWNPYRHFAPKSALWGRGTPLSRVRGLVDGQTVELTNVSREFFRTSPHIIQYLVDNEPDLDAIYRLTQTEIIHNFEESDELVLLPKGTFSPANTQATIWRNIRSVDPLYFPSTVSLRIADILKMYMAQVQLPLVYGGFNVRQERNPHDFFQDFIQEVEMYLDAEKWIQLLKVLAAGSPSTRVVYELFVKEGLLPAEELSILDAYLSAG
jgi:hypothetical protein